MIYFSFVSLSTDNSIENGVPMFTTIVFSLDDVLRPFRCKNSIVSTSSFVVVFDCLTVLTDFSHIE